jgi:hypothetical protein
VGVVVIREDVGGEDDERAVRELCVLIPKSLLIHLVSDLAGEAEKRALELRRRRRFLRRSLDDFVTTWLDHMIFYCSRHCPVGKCNYLGAESSCTSEQHNNNR